MGEGKKKLIGKLIVIRYYDPFKAFRARPYLEAPGNS